MGGIRGDRFKPCDPDDSELKRRYHTLFEDEKIDLGLFRVSLTGIPLIFMVPLIPN